MISPSTLHDIEVASTVSFSFVSFFVSGAKNESSANIDTNLFLISTISFSDHFGMTSPSKGPAF